MADKMDTENKGSARTLEEALAEEEEDVIDQDVLNGSVEEIVARTKALEREIQILRHESNRMHHEETALKEKIKENMEKIKLNRQLPYLVANVVEVSEQILTTKQFFDVIFDIVSIFSIFQQYLTLYCLLQLIDAEPEDLEEDGSSMDVDAQSQNGKCAVIKTSDRKVHIDTIPSAFFFT